MYDVRFAEEHEIEIEIELLVFITGRDIFLKIQENFQFSEWAEIFS